MPKTNYLGGSVLMSTISQETTSNVLYYDSTNGSVSYGDASVLSNLVDSETSIVSGKRIYQELDPSTSFNSVNGYVGLAKDSYPAVSEATAEKAVNEWNLISTSPNLWWGAIAWSDTLGIFCAVGFNGTSVITSTDGINWNSSATALRSYHVIWSKERSIFCAVGNDGNKVQTSPDGINWTEIPSIDPDALNIEWYQVAWSPQLELFCAVGTGSSGLKRVMTSSDGIVWELQDTPNNNEVLVSIGWSPELGVFCAGENSSRILYSYDGKIWNYGKGNIPGTWRQMVWSSSLGIFCSVSYNNGNICTSKDGINWTLSTSPSSMQWWGLTWSEELGIFVATASANNGTNSKITYSYDGINWLLVPNGNYNRNMRSIAWSPELGIFCATGTGQGGVIISSLLGRPPTSYNVFDNESNNIDNNGEWTFKIKQIDSGTSLLIDSPSVNLTGNLVFDNTNSLSPSAGVDSGQFLRINIDGTNYKIKLLND